MTAEQWLSSEQDYQVGLSILKETKPSGFLISMLEKKETSFNRKKLCEAIQALAPKPKAAKKATSQNRTKPSSLFTPPKPKAFHLDNSEYPEELHPAVERLKNRYNVVNHVHPLLMPTYATDRGKCFDLKNVLLEAWTEIDQIWRILNYFKEHQVVLPNPYSKKTEQPVFDRATLVKKRNNLRTYLSKHRSNPKRIDDVKQWQKELNELNAILMDA